MSERLTEALSAAGRSPGRRVDVTGWVSEIRADGPEVPADLVALKPEDLRTVSELLAGSADREG